jgi:rare lipoprotein A
MGAMKNLLIAIEENCGVCNEIKGCENCKMRIDLGDRIIYVNGKTREIKGVELKSDLAKLGGFILSCMKVCVVVCMMASSVYAFETEASYYTVASCLREGTSGICANGEKLNDKALTCASWDFKFNTLLKVTNIENGKSVIVRVNDRGPNKRLYRGGRRIDLSLAAMRKITSGGLCRVSVERI